MARELADPGGGPDRTDAGPGRPPDALAALERAGPDLAARAVERMHAKLPWMSRLPAEHRASLGTVVQAGVRLFVEWCRRPEHARRLSSQVFRVAPRPLVRAVSLQQLVELVRVAVDVVEEAVPTLAADPAQELRLRSDVLLYSRDIAFAGALVYARAAEERGAWDARLEALVVDHVLRGEVDADLSSRAAALGWTGRGAVTVVVGPPVTPDPEAVVHVVRRAARGAGLDVLTGVHGERLAVIVGTRDERGVADPLTAADTLLAAYGPGAVVAGPTVPTLAEAALSARAATAGAAAVAAWPAAPRPVTADALLPERAIAGDPLATDRLARTVHAPLRAAGAGLVETTAAYLDAGASLQGAARTLFLHPNTVRYRLRRVALVSGLDPTVPRDAFTLRVALVVGRLTS